MGKKSQAEAIGRELRELHADLTACRARSTASLSRASRKDCKGHARAAEGKRSLIRVTLEFRSATHPMRSRVIGIAEIRHAGHTIFDTNGEFGDYQVLLSATPPNGCKAFKIGKVFRFARRRHGPWDLLYLALKHTVGPRSFGSL